MEQKNAMLELLYSKGDELKTEQIKRTEENRKLNQNKEWFGLMALDRVEKKSANKIYSTSELCVKADNLLKAAKTELETIRAKEFPDVVAAIEDLKNLKSALKEFILSGKPLNFNGKEVKTLPDILGVYRTIEERMKKN